MRIKDSLVSPWAWPRMFDFICCAYLELLITFLKLLRGPVPVAILLFAYHAVVFVVTLRRTYYI